MIPDKKSNAKGKLVIFYPQGIGNFFLTIDSVVSLVLAFDETIIYVHQSHTAEIFKKLFNDDNKVTITIRKIQLFQSLLANNNDVFVIWENLTWKSVVLGAICNGKCVGFNLRESKRKNFYGRLAKTLGITVVPVSKNVSESVWARSLLTQLGVVHNSLGVQMLHKLVQRQSFPIGVNDSRVVCLHLGCNKNSSNKRWPVSNFVAVSSLVSQFKFKIYVIGGADDIAVTAAYISEGGVLHENFVDKCSLLDTAALLSKSSMLISNDSGLMHLASVLQIPQVAIFSSDSFCSKNIPLRTHSLSKFLGPLNAVDRFPPDDLVSDEILKVLECV